MNEAPSALGLNVAMFTPWHAHCGIRDYTAHLIAALDNLEEIATTRIVAAPVGAVRADTGSLISRYLRDAGIYQELGRQMNSAADVAHIQHQYFLFGGVAPYKTHVRDFLSSITIPAVVTLHEIAEPRGGPLRWLGTALANRMNFRHPALRGFIVHTEADRLRLAGIGVLEDRIHLIRHPTPPALPIPEPGTTRRAWQREYPQLTGRKVVTVFGFLSRKKGHAVALEALSRLPDDVALVFAGGRHPDDNTDYVATLESDIARLRLEGRVVITGYLEPPQVPEIMAITDMALAPFLDTSGSGSLANLLSYGRSIVASDIPPHREILAQYPGLLVLFPTENAAGLAAAVAELLADTPRRTALSAAALQYAAAHSYAEMARETVRVYQCVRNG